MAYHRTSYAVWEITLKCNLACSHCGSRAGQARAKELSTEEALDLVQQMAEVGIKEVTLIGGEAFLRPDWLEIAAAINQAGMRCTMTTGGYGISLATATKMKAAGIATVSVSIDGLEATHDTLRGRNGAWRYAFQTMGHLREVGIPFGCNTQINRLSAPELPSIYEHIRAAGAGAWQLQLTVPMGHAADHAEILLQPYELLDLYPMLARIAVRAQREGLQLQPGNNIGYYGPYERLLRGRGKDNDWAFWRGCSAGLSTLGIEADGAIKGCPSLPTAAYTGGNIRDRNLRDIVESTEELRFNLGAGTPQGTAHLWGFCKTCEFAELCRGGCTWTSHVFFDRRGNNPYCHHRALTQAQQGKRERLQLKRQADGLPFDNGEFELMEEPVDAPWDKTDSLHFTADQVQWSTSWQAEESLALTTS
ncbi:nif11-class peptide radical SAM maturase 3 [Leptothoe spongobia]|uniref:Nif11-class peptide radical SAM maturase 3 n=1 Tax=Leptothoe spongobia TAU-MAC 1115 TaxID=1967444 RepID=A0A947DDB7_9CYAN|nr:nif11-class peptide radical SAM maturase 3 [Leptothoe spongobia]MBT9314434.1 nif11-class peptide radical SAM maturase 3 [Leptothoe spongobia TAU-MAC 1115]